MNPLIQARVKKFAKRHGFDDNLGTAFEKWSANLLFSETLLDDSERIESTVIGGGEDGGVDAFLVSVNNSPVFDPSEISQQCSQDAPKLTVKVQFLQAKAREKFELSGITRFLSGVERLTRAAIDGEYEELDVGLRSGAQILNAVIQNIESFESIRIPVEIYYVTTSPNSADPVCEQPAVTEIVHRLKSLEVYEDVDPQFVGLHDLNQIIEANNGPRNIGFKFSNKVTISPAQDVVQAYVGTLPVIELAPLLLDDKGRLRKGIFDANVRLYQGRNNEVNQNIAQTLRRDDNSLFPYLNNGITIVANGLENTADQYRISSYQIVNGCQTSNEIVSWIKELVEEKNEELGRKVAWDFSLLKDIPVLSETMVPVKIVQTNSSDIKSYITVATNHQTAIGETDMQGSSRLAKEVEEFFANSGPQGLRYQRQMGESEDSFTKTRTINTDNLNRAFSAAILGESATSIGKQKELRGLDSEVWNDYPLELYYYAALVNYKVERRLAQDDSGIRAAKYHLDMLTSYIAFPKIEQLFGGGAKGSIKKSIAKKVSVSAAEEKIQNALECSVDIVCSYFEDKLKVKSLIKDDVRSNKTQDELLNLAKKNSSGEVL